MKDTDNWFCLDAATGDIFFLGNHGDHGDHGDFQAAEDTVSSLGINSVWTFGGDTARRWAHQLAHHLENAE